MHWGHVVSRDLIKWERRPAAMAPDQEYDNAGCFSGSALELSDGRHLLMYTGVQKVTERMEAAEIIRRSAWRLAMEQTMKSMKTIL